MERKNKLFARVGYTPGQWDFSAEAVSIWGLLTGGPEKSDYAMVNLRGAYTLDRSDGPVTLFLKLDNINNKHYEITYGCPMPGFTMMGGVDFRF